tara:strand:+ start:751 stop:981 length:231 start_codon:yes stop_codon:yes gene_type:complete
MAKLNKLGIDADLSDTLLGCNWEIEKLDYHLDRLLQYLHENRLPRILLLSLIQEAEEAKVELREVFNKLYLKDRRT